jgi:hypothetical protein
MSVERRILVQATVSLWISPAEWSATYGLAPDEVMGDVHTCMTHRLDVIARGLLLISTGEVTVSPLLVRLERFEEVRNRLSAQE